MALRTAQELLIGQQSTSTPQASASLSTKPPGAGLTLARMPTQLLMQELLMGSGITSVPATPVISWTWINFPGDNRPVRAERNQEIVVPLISFAPKHQEVYNLSRRLKHYTLFPCPTYTTKGLTTYYAYAAVDIVYLDDRTVDRGLWRALPAR